MENNKNSRKKDEMDFKEIEKIYNIMLHSSLTEIELEEKDCRIKIRRKIKKNFEKEKDIDENKNLSKPSPSFSGEEIIENSEFIKSPVAGVFYRSPSPESSPFVELSAVVEKGKTVCIVEAMKVMNEIQAEKRCKIIKILTQNGMPVQQGENLFLVARM